MRFVVTILEETPERAIETIRSIDADHDAIELRIDAFGGRAFDLRAIRTASTKPVILTNRGGERIDIAAALDAGIDLVDVEYRPDLDPGEIGRYAGRIVLSHHDYESTPNLDKLVRAMRTLGCAHTKIAVTPGSFDDNRRLLASIDGDGVTLIGMGERGLYSRILAPFFGSELQFVSVDDARSAAPGQLTLAQALAIYGRDHSSLHAEHIFAIAGNPAAHSGSPAIHNARFRDLGIPAAYTIYSGGDFLEIAEPFARGDRFAPTGLSITAPFKEEAFAFARSIGATIASNAMESRAVNTLVRERDGGVIADNTDVDGFTTLLQQVCGRDRKSVALLGAGGTARAALVAMRRERMHVTIYNRTLDNARALHERAEPLDALPRFNGEIVINTLSTGAEVALPPMRAGMTYIEAAYGGVSERQTDDARRQGVQVFDGRDLLEAQALRQSALFVKRSEQ